APRRRRPHPPPPPPSPAAAPRAPCAGGGAGGGAPPPPPQNPPRTGERPRLFEPVQRGIHGALWQFERTIAAVPQPGDHLVSVAGAPAEHRKQEQVKVSLELLGSHT